MPVPFKLVSFDLDGTLLRHTTALVFLAKQMGHEPTLQELERRFLSHEISNSVVAERSANFFAGTTKEVIWKWLGNAPWIPGLESTVRTLKASGCQVLIGTITWKFVAEFLQSLYPFDAISGTEMEEVGGRLTGRIRRYFDEHDKLAFVEKHCAEQGLSLHDCVAVGDSRSDIPLFKRVGLAIALNATREARDAAHICLESEDLSEVLRPILQPAT
ncbi:MAG TPA: HAD family phosphatase [Candidatus Angelobacter sp.]